MGNARNAPLGAVLAIFFAGCISTTGYDNAVSGSRPAASDAAPLEVGADEDAPPPPKAVVDDTGPFDIGVSDATLLALENNPGLMVQRFAPASRATLEQEAAAAFDTTLSASYTSSNVENSQGAGASTHSGSGSLGISSLLASGTQVSLDVSGSHVNPTTGANPDTANVTFGVSQSLLRGASPAANLAAVRQAALDTRSSEYELRGYTEALVAQVETAYWDYVLAKKRIEIYEESVRLAETQLNETQERINVGRLAETELAAARAELESRKEALIGARGAMATAKIRLLRLMNPPSGPSQGGFWEREVILKDPPSVPPDELEDVLQHVRNALVMRSDLNQARLAITRGELEIVRTKSGLLPRLDLFVNLGRTGYADSFQTASEDLSGDGQTLSGGMTFEWALGNGAARARQRRASLGREQAEVALENLTQLAQVDVRTAHIAVATTKEQLSATAATRTYREETLRTEAEKLRVGKSTTFQVALAQRDLVASQIAEGQAVVDYLKALIDLYRADGSLLVRRGVDAPGAAPPDAGSRR
jgi:outer membrane protein TolC